MSDTPHATPANRNLEDTVGRILRLGVIVSFSLVVLGTVVWFLSPTDHPTASTLAIIMQHDAPPTNTIAPPDQPTVAPAPQPAQVIEPAHFPNSITAILRDALTLRGPALVMLGILVLVSTPVIRVVASIILFAIQRDYVYTLTTTLVLILLAASLFLGKAV